ncbi:hypothetical protein GUJ93_ZPchr0001g32369 [Zizania palustris]|uniref:UspA domain-containing protein n=1 Tax=Zizania palustris TaxID=103762 RepID=A0A8J5RPN9_ZIZPA|nr:hypothetical protein GUJ93_ZPchr0001g32369 [Zizania palustris]
MLSPSLPLTGPPAPAPRAQDSLAELSFTPGILTSRPSEATLVSEPASTDLPTAPTTGRYMGGRKIGVAVDFSSCSKAALRWASTNLTRNGDQLILIHVNSSYQNEQAFIPLEEFSDPHVAKTYAVSPDNETLEILTQISKQGGIEVIAKIFYGDPAKKLYEAVDLVPLSCLVVGNRG